MFCDRVFCGGNKIIDIKQETLIKDDGSAKFFSWNLLWNGIVIINGYNYCWQILDEEMTDMLNPHSNQMKIREHPQLGM